MMPYILHVGLILATCLVFYKILLQRETFFRLNRWILIVCLLVSFSIPLLPVPAQFSFRTPDMSSVLAPELLTQDIPATVDAIKEPAAPATSVQAHEGIHWWTLVLLVYWCGVGVFAINFLVQIIALLYRAYTRPVIRDGKFRIVEVSGDKAPCSFANNIFINPEKYDWETYNQILEHEKIHVREGHTLDLILSEIAIIFQWFNPFAWWYRKSLENNLEFLTDARFLHQPEAEKTTYQMSLLKVSAPHFPLSLTTNYNQSLLKKRVAMMNAKKSNVHTTWKYLFLLPLLVLSVCLLNEPVLKAQSPTVKEKMKNKVNNTGLPTEGYWFAIIRDTEVNITFKRDEGEKGHNISSFPLTEFRNMPREGSGTFTVTRDAGTMEFTGKMEGNQGMGRYKFIADKNYESNMRKEGIEFSDESDQIVFFMIDVKQSYVQMLKRNGYTSLDKDDVIPMAALHVDEEYIESFKKNGFPNVPMSELVPLKALNVTPEYVAEIRKAGFPNVSLNQLVTFKAQGIDAKYLADIKKSGIGNNGNKNNPQNKNADKEENKNDNDNEQGSAGVSYRNIDDIVAFKSLAIDAEYVNSLKEVGYTDLSDNDLISMKGIGIDAAYIKSWQAAGYKNIPIYDLVAVKAQSITPEYLKSFASAGYASLSLPKAIPLKALGVTPEYINSFKEIGYNYISVDNAVGLKSQNITPAIVKEYNQLGIGVVTLDNIVGAKATGTTPAFIRSMMEKGHKFRSIDKYITLKTLGSGDEWQ